MGEDDGYVLVDRDSACILELLGGIFSEKWSREVWSVAEDNVIQRTLAQASFT